MPRWPKRTFAERFWEKVDQRADDVCWLWNGRARHWAGYGMFHVGNDRAEQAHRVAYALAIGPIPSGLGVLHRCDNPPCCNPSHLFLGTQADNLKDMWAKGRARPHGKVPA
jgi:hypothetical protein